MAYSINDVRIRRLGDTSTTIYRGEPLSYYQFWVSLTNDYNGFYWLSMYINNIKVAEWNLSSYGVWTKVISSSDFGMYGYQKTDDLLNAANVPKSATSCSICFQLTYQPW